MSRRRAVLGALALAAGAAGYVFTSSSVPKEPGFHARDCWFSSDIGGGALCGTLVVRENRQRPNGRTIGLPVVILKAEGEGPYGAPIVYLNGGPGDRTFFSNQREIDFWRSWGNDFPPDRDLILVGQRGTGLGKADFDCPELKTAEISLGAHAPGSDPPDARAIAVQATISCSARLLSEGVDLSAYNSRESAADIAELRRALEIESWTLYGISYGTRLALSVLRYHPEGVGAVILDGVVPPEAAEGLEVAKNYRGALQQLFDDCAENPDCARRYGDLERRYRELIGRFKARPLTLPLADYLDPEELALFGDGEGLVISFDHTWFDTLLLDALLDTRVPFLVPILIEDLEGQNFVTLKDRLRESLLFALETNEYNSWAVYLSHLCRDEAAFETSADIAAAAKAAGELGYLVEDYAPNYLCAHWPSGRADPLENSPVTSDVPTLLLSGRLDPLTPPASARQAAEHLSRGYPFTLTAQSHGALFNSACAAHLVRSFLKSLKRPTETGCKAGDLVVTAAD